MSHQTLSPAAARFGSLVASILTLLILPSGGAYAGELPSPIATEAVFPGIIFGDSGAVRFEAAITVTNAGDREAFVRFDLFSNDGSPARLSIYPYEEPYPTLWLTLVPPRSSRTIVYNGPENLLLAPPSLFQGWGILRSNRPVNATVTLRVFDQRNGESTSEFVMVGNAGRLSDVRMPVVTGVAANQSGIAVAVPALNCPCPLRVQLLDLQLFFDAPETAEPVAEKVVVVPSYGQAAFSVSDLFPGQRGDFVRIDSEDGTSFAVVLIQFSFFRDSGQLQLRHPSAFDHAGNARFAYEDAGAWAFDAGFQPPNMVGETQLTATDFGVYVESPAQLQFYPFAQPTIVTEPQLEVAVAGDLRAKIIVFGDGLTIEETLPGSHLEIRTLEDGRIEIESRFQVDVGLIALAHKLVLIDPQSRTIVARFTGAIEQDPPWRDQP